MYLVTLLPHFDKQQITTVRDATVILSPRCSYVVEGFSCNSVKEEQSLLLSW